MRKRLASNHRSKAASKDFFFGLTNSSKLSQNFRLQNSKESRFSKKVFASSRRPVTSVVVYAG